MKKAKELVRSMTLEEKASLCSGLDFWHLKGIDRLDLPPIMVTDGPHGLRKQAGDSDHLGINDSVPATCFPAACASSSSFDRELLYEVGEAIGEECQAEDVAVILGPGANIKRSPLCGRNFEYISEDPYVTGELSSSLINGVQSKGVGTSLKHFAGNNQEKARMTSDSVIDERALKEIYLSGFETAVKKSQPWTVMCSYNRLNGTYASENKELLTDILRTQWEFQGLVVTDWGATNNRVEGIKAGLDLEMPSSNGMNDKQIVDAVQSGELDATLVDVCAERVVELILKYKGNNNKKPYDQKAHHELARRAASESAVLLKNDAILPLDQTKSIAVLGQFAKAPRYQGAGSSKINPHVIDSPFDAMQGAGFDVAYADGYDLKSKEVDDAMISQAVELAREKDIAVIYAGLPDEYESEGFDRVNLDMPESHNRLIQEVAKVNSNTVVVLQCGAPVVMPWEENVKAILLMYLGGEAVGSACADLLSGRVVPSGKLAETFPIRLEDTPCYCYFPGTTRSTEYRESIFVGYRFYDTAKRAVAYPFGYGLSYSTFEVSDMTLSNDHFTKDSEISVSVKVKNMGAVAAAEVVQLYVSAADSVLYRPEKELKRFDKVFLQPGEERTVSFVLDSRCFSYYNVAVSDWAIESGQYHIKVGTSSRDIVCETSLSVEGDGLESKLPDYKAITHTYYALPTTGSFEIDENDFSALYGKPLPPSKRMPDEPYTVNDTLGDIKDTPVGQQMIDMIQQQAGAMFEGSDDIKLMMSAMMMDMPLRSLVMMGQGAFTAEQLEGVIQALNAE